MAREGADVSIVYLPEKEDAQDTKIVEKAGRRAYLMALNLPGGGGRWRST